MLRRLPVFLLAAAAVLLPLLTIAGVGRAGGLEWWCSHAAPSALAALEVHWPHFLPILPGLATLVYLWRANARRG
jgi:hypothetical protein